MKIQEYSFIGRISIQQRQSLDPLEQRARFPDVGDVAGVPWGIHPDDQTVRTLGGWHGLEDHDEQQ